MMAVMHGKGERDRDTETQREKVQKELGRESKRQNIFFKMLPQVDRLPGKGEENFLLRIFPKNSNY